jgi:hypothetical protein
MAAFQFRPDGDAGHLLLECAVTAGILELDDLGVIEPPGQLCNRLQIWSGSRGGGVKP